jgi:mRNA interferase RelE/StbE
VPWSLGEPPRRVRRDLERVPEPDRTAILDAVDALVANPGRADITKLGGNEWRLRVGRWRVIFEMDNRAGTITVLRVLPRNEGTYRR